MRRILGAGVDNGLKQLLFLARREHLLELVEHVFALRLSLAKGEERFLDLFLVVEDQHVSHLTGRLEKRFHRRARRDHFGHSDRREPLDDAIELAQPQQAGARDDGQEHDDQAEAQAQARSDAHLPQ